MSLEVHVSCRSLAPDLGCRIRMISFLRCCIFEGGSEKPFLLLRVGCTVGLTYNLLSSVWRCISADVCVENG